jgi:hypothetical protein
MTGMEHRTGPDMRTTGKGGAYHGTQGAIRISFRYHNRTPDGRQETLCITQPMRQQVEQAIRDHTRDLLTTWTPRELAGGYYTGGHCFLGVTSVIYHTRMKDQEGHRVYIEYSIDGWDTIGSIGLITLDVLVRTCTNIQNHYIPREGSMEFL